ncbi:MAG: efflux RND transporter permease subunit, partial [Gemmataceae bacterium]
ETLDVPIDSVFNTLQAYLGSTYVNNFTKYNRTYQVRVQADSQYRLRASDIVPLEVRNKQGQMLPLGSVCSIEEKVGPALVNRYNMYPSAAITGQAAPGFSSGDALAAMEKLADENRVAYDWTGMSYQEKQVGNEALYVFAFAVLMVYLVLCALYESLTNPAAVIFVVPLALLGAVIGVAVRGLDNNVYTQIGIVLVIALASKNAILIVEFARDLRHKGMSVADAAVEASRSRFRPILMTSFAFILGVYPLVIATGAGAASRQALGTAVFGGMLASTFLAVMFVPVFYTIFQGLSERRNPLPVHAPASETTAPPPPAEQPPREEHHE